MRRLKIGSRGSVLAMWQASFIRDWLVRECGVAAEIVVIKTSGDRFQQGNISQIGLKGVFIKELEDALLEERVDLAVHSMKDVPTEVPPGLTFPAVAKRVDVRDALISRTGAGLSDLPRGARIGTSSLRRAAQLKRHRGDLETLELRGNVDTRLAKLDRGDYDAIVLAKAGLDRLGWSKRISEVLPASVSLPAVGQGALGIETRASDSETIAAVSRLDDAETRIGVESERALLARLEGGCQLPLGAWGRVEGGRLILEARVLAADGSEHIDDRIEAEPSRAKQAGQELAERMIRAGADRILRMAGRSVGSA